MDKHSMWPYQSLNFCLFPEVYSKPDSAGIKSGQSRDVLISVRGQNNSGVSGSCFTWLALSTQLGPLLGNWLWAGSFLSLRWKVASERSLFRCWRDQSSWDTSSGVLRWGVWFLPTQWIQGVKKRQVLTRCSHPESATLLLQENGFLQPLSQLLTI